MYAIIRSVLLIIIILYIATFAKKLTIKTFQKILTLILCVMLSLIICFFPFENLFYSFSSPKELLNYYISTDEIVDVVHGEDSCMIYYQTDKNSYSYIFSRRNESGYKILNYFSYKKISSKIYSSGSISVYNVSGTQDFYVIATINTDDKVEIYDGNNIKIDADIKRVKNTNFLFFTIRDFTDEHYLLIDTEKIKMK